MSPKDTAYIVERLAVRFMAMVAEYERKLLEHRDAFGARTEADRRIIEGLRAIMAERGLEAFEAGSVLGCVGDESPMQAARRVVKERDGLLTQVKDQRAEIERLRNDERKAYQDGDALRVERDALRVEVAALQDRLRASIARGDFAEIEVARLKAQTPKRSHPVKVGEWVRRTSEPYGGVSIGTIGKVLGFAAEHYSIAVEQCWYFKYCEPCDPPVDHDTPAGKEAAKAVIRDSQMTEIKAGTKLRLCKVPMPDPQLSGLVDFPWNAEWGSVGDVAEVINTLNPASLPAVAVRLESELVVWWPRSCIEIVRKVPQ